nr:MAG TPA: hypothetical protein [Caudoviricetes sp.]
MVSKTHKRMNRGHKFLNSNYKNFVKAKAIEADHNGIKNTQKNESRS